MRDHPVAAYTPLEMMMIAAARQLTSGDVCFVGIGAPSAACNLARLTHAPGITLIYESGTLEAKPYVLPLSIGDPELCETALTTVSVPEMFAYWLQGGLDGRGLLRFTGGDGGAGHGEGGDHRRRLGFVTAGPTLIVTNLCLMRPDPETKEFTVTSIHPGVRREEIAERTGWPVRFADDVEDTLPPDDEELAVLRDLQTRSAPGSGAS